jgi:hypothetical protein
MSSQHEIYRYLGIGVKKTTRLPARRVRKGRQFLKNINCLSLLATTRSPSTW